MRPRRFRRHSEPPGIWRGRPSLGSRWRFGGTTWRLTEIAIDQQWPSGGMLRMEWAEDRAWRDIHELPRRPWWQPWKPRGLDSFAPPPPVPYDGPVRDADDGSPVS